MYNLENENGFIKKIIESRGEFKEYQQFITEEKSEDVNKLVDYIKQSYQKKTDIGELNSEYEWYNEAFSNCTGALTDFVLKHQTDSNYIENIIEQMPFMNRAAFINESVLKMLAKERFGQYVEYTNAFDVYERNIDKEIRSKLNEKDFGKLCDELYLQTGYIDDPTGIRRVVPKYDCINFSLFRLDEELKAGKFIREFKAMGWMNGKEILDEVYKFDRNIYEKHSPEKLEEMDEEDKEVYIENLYWAQKITDEDKIRLGITEEKEFSEQQIGKKTINIQTEKKDRAYDKVQKKVNERTHSEEVHEKFQSN